MRPGRLGPSWIVGLCLLTAGTLATHSKVPTETGEENRPALVLLVRHAEKAHHQGEDPALTAAGEERALALAEALHDAGVTHIITTQLRRTRDTAKPLADELGIQAEVFPVSTRWEGLEEHARRVADAVRRHPGGIVLVVGHQNTVPLIIEALGGPHLPDMGDPVYDNLFVLVPGPTKARLVRSRYGAPNPIVDSSRVGAAVPPMEVNPGRPTVEPSASASRGANRVLLPAQSARARRLARTLRASK